MVSVRQSDAYRPPALMSSGGNRTPGVAIDAFVAVFRFDRRHTTVVVVRSVSSTSTPPGVGSTVARVSDIMTGSTGAWSSFGSMERGEQPQMRSRNCVALARLTGVRREQTC